MRPATPADVAFLEEMLYEAAAWRDRRCGRRTVYAPLRSEIARYLVEWGRPGDTGIVAEDYGSPIGAAWYRSFRREEPGFAFLSESIPELTIAVAPEARGRGVGTALLRAVEARARSDGKRALSLSVEVDNPALRLYERAGFERLRRNGNAWTMRLELRPR